MIPFIEYACLIVFLAAFIRAYTGFGFAAISIVGLNIFWPVKMNIPLILIIDLACSLTLLKSAFEDSDKNVLKQLVIGALVGAPVGVFLLFIISDIWLKLLISVLILFVVIKLALPKSHQNKPLSSYMNIFTGGASATVTAAASTGGLPLAAYLLQSDLSVQKQRGLMIVFLSGSTVLSLVIMSCTGLIDTTLVRPATWTLPAAIFGIFLGKKYFEKKPPLSFRPLVLPILFFLAAYSLWTNTSSFL